MNISVHEDIADAIAMVRPEVWQEFFEEGRQEIYSALRTTPDESLTCARDRVKMLDEVEEFFLRITNKPKSQ